jgi:hypothetical protein
MMLRRVIALVVLALAASMTIASCGDSDDGGTAKKSTPSSAATQTPTATPDRSADRRIARDSTLKLEDFPSGWTEADDESGRARCEGIEEVKKATSARATSSRFGKGENTSVQNSIYIFGEEAAAEQAFTQLAAKDTRTCYAKRVTDALESAGGLTVGEAESARLSLDPLGDQREAARVTVPVTSQGVDVDVIVDLIFVRVDRGISIGLFIDAFSPFDDDLRGQLTATSVRRLSDNVASG